MRNRQKWTIVIVGLLLVLAVVILTVTATRSERIRVGHAPLTVTLPLYAAISQGFFESEGLEIELVKLGSANELLNSLVAGDLDIISMVGLPSIIAAAQEAQESFLLGAIAEENDSLYANFLLTSSRLSIDSVSELRGKKIGAYSGASQLINLKMILDNFLDVERDVEIIQVPMGLEVSALASGQFDALFTIEPTATIALEKGVARVLIENPRCKYIMCPFPVSSTVFSSEYVKHHPTVAQKFLRSLDRAIEYIREHEGDARAFLVTFASLDTSVAMKSRLYHWVKSNDVDRLQVQKLADLLFETKILTKQVHTKNMFLSSSHK